MLEQEYKAAVREVEFLVKMQARTMQGFGWSYYTTDNAPETFKELKDQAKNMVIPIADYGSNTSIYGSTATNTLFRFWHDVLHLENNLGFNLKDETTVADLHLEAGKAFNLSPLALLILEADTKGQVQYYFKHKEFVSNQEAFVQSCIKHGIKTAIKFKH